MADVFVSYKREDAVKVRKLVAALRGAGLDVWWDEDIPSGTQWEATIERFLAAAKAVVVCWSPASVASENVRSEARVAREDGRLVQVFLKACKPPLFFGERQGLDLTRWRGDAEDEVIAKLKECVRRVAAGERVEGGPIPKIRRWLEYPVQVAAAILILLGGSLAGWWLIAPAKAHGPMTLAVLPFRALNAADANLVDAIWDDTRGAISKNPNLRVLGREAVTALAKQDLAPAGYRKKVGADYILDGTVEHVGDQVRMELSLTRTTDAAEVWNGEVGGKLDDVFAFQQRVASEVEGRIRGRVAPGGGVKAQNIATSGEVYAIYADARALMRKREADSIRAAVPLLRKAVSIDPNYAPAWAVLGQAMAYSIARQPGMTFEDQRKLGINYAKQALELAPNLSQAHAVMGMMRGLEPVAGIELRKAVALDPNNSEAWGWLGNFLTYNGRYSEALEAYTRAEQIEPLWTFTVINRIGSLVALRDTAGINAEFQRIKQAGDPILLMKAQALTASALGHPGDGIRIALQLRAMHPEEASWIDPRIAPDLFGLGFVEEAMASGHFSAQSMNLYRNGPPPASDIRRSLKGPLDFWLGNDLPFAYARMLPKRGRLNEFIGYYRAAFRDAEDYAANLPGRSYQITPSVVADLRAGGMKDEADAILHHFEPPLVARSQGQMSAVDYMMLAKYRALDGSDEAAVKLLAKAVDRGLLPDGRFYATDIADEPAFAAIVNRPDFRAVRRRIFERLQDERRKVPLGLLAHAYPTKQLKAAA